MNVNDFSHDLDFSYEHIDDDEAIMAKLYPGFIAVKAQLELDRRGVDYFLFRCLPDGTANIALVDIKRRRAGARRYWRYGEPEVVIELGDDGWLFKVDSLTVTVVYAFDAEDSAIDYAVSYSDLRSVALEHKSDWESRFGIKRQRNSFSGSCYTSTAIFVPVSELEVAGVFVHKIPKGDNL